MSKSTNDANDYAQRLYARVPANYRAYDEEQGKPLFALLELVGAQVANLRKDLDDLWDNFFIETCDDWVVPYLAALVGTNLLAQPIGQSNRLDVRNTIHWRRSKGTPEMLRALGKAISGWPTELAEFYRTIGWSQNVNHVRKDALLTVDVHDPLRLSRLGHSDDPWAHAIDIRSAAFLDQARVTQRSLGIGESAWGTPGRHQIKNLGFFVNRLQTFPIFNATPAAIRPGLMPDMDPNYFTFDPLFRDSPLFEQASRTPITRAAFGSDPTRVFGKDIGVRKFGILLATDQETRTIQNTSSTEKFSFGSSTDQRSLHSEVGLRWMESQSFQPGDRRFIVTATWRTGSGDTFLGSLKLLNNDYQSGEAATGEGQLVVTVQLDPEDKRFQSVLSSPASHFPGAVIAMRAAQKGALRVADGCYLYLGAGVVSQKKPLELFVAKDGSTYTSGKLDSSSLARASQGQVYPPRNCTRSLRPATLFAPTNGNLIPLQPIDPSRFNGTVIPQIVAESMSTHLAIRITAAAGSFVPASEVVIKNDRQESLLVYLPEIDHAANGGDVYLVADDGSTYRLEQTIDHQSAMTLKRESAGQVLPMENVWPLQQRRPVALDLCRGERRRLLSHGELGIDPELGRFAFPLDDPANKTNDLSVDYVEAFSDSIGARTSDRTFEPLTSDVQHWTVSATDSDADFRSITEAFVALDAFTEKPSVAIEITDSATYTMPRGITLRNKSVKKLVIRSSNNERPCLTFYSDDGMPWNFSLQINSPLESLELNGLLISGGPIRIFEKIDTLFVFASTLDPLSSQALHSAWQPALSAELAMSEPYSRDSHYFICRSIVGALHIDNQIGRLTVADSIVDSPLPINSTNADTDDSPVRNPAIVGTDNKPVRNVQLERVTVLGSVVCDVLTASECIFDETIQVTDRQAGCIRFCRFEYDAVDRHPLALPRRYLCIPTEEQMLDHRARHRLLAPMFNSRRFGRPDYLQLAAGCPASILGASEQRGEIGAFAGTQNVLRLANLRTKLQEFLPVGLTALVIAET